MRELLLLQEDYSARIDRVRAGQIGGLLILPVEDQRDEHWEERALCAQTDPESFFPEKGGSTREAKQVCQNCEVRNECLEDALEKNERFGIRGGLSERERRKLQKRMV